MKRKYKRRGVNKVKIFQILPTLNNLRARAGKTPEPGWARQDKTTLFVRADMRRRKRNSRFALVHYLLNRSASNGGGGAPVTRLRSAKCSRKVALADASTITAAQSAHGHRR